jgi:hypothetical protein
MALSIYVCVWSDVEEDREWAVKPADKIGHPAV